MLYSFTFFLQVFFKWVISKHAFARYWMLQLSGATAMVLTKMGTPRGTPLAETEAPVQLRAGQRILLGWCGTGNTWKESPKKNWGNQRVKLGDCRLFGHVAEAWEEVMGQIVTWKTSQSWYWETMYQHRWRLWLKESQAHHPGLDLPVSQGRQHYFLAAWINCIKPPISFAPVSRRWNGRWGYAMVLEKQAFDTGDKMLFANVCDCHSFKLGFSILLQVLLHFSSHFFPSFTTNLLCAEMQHRKHLEYKDKAVFPSFEFLNWV